MRVKTLLLTTIIALMPLSTVSYEPAQARWTDEATYKIEDSVLTAYGSPSIEDQSAFNLYKGMTVESQSLKLVNQELWIETKVGGKSYWIPATEGSRTKVSLKKDLDSGVVDYYGILDQPHRYAVKLVKLPGANGRLETYEKTETGYAYRQSYEVRYPKEGPKNRYGDLKTVGGPVVRYLYRTTRSSRNGRYEGEFFGVYKVSYPMPHDALPYLEAGKMSVAQYQRIPAINFRGPEENRQLYPHPQGILGADIVVHTDAWGTLGCIIMPSGDMHKLYHEDLVTENDKEIIPFIIYDEGVTAPKEGQLFL